MYCFNRIAFYVILWTQTFPTTTIESYLTSWVSDIDIDEITSLS